MDADEIEQDARLRELVTGFALGELGDDELKELYETLRADADNGHAARLAWETLGSVMDLRAGMGSRFQDALYLRLGEQESDEQFAARIRTRLGQQRPALGEVEPPGPPPRRRRWPLVAAASALLALAIGGIVVLRGGGEPALAEVTGLAGGALLDGRALTVGAGVDRRQLVVPAGSALRLTWPDGTVVSLAGPAAAVCGERALTLVSGQAWIQARGRFTIGLPDRARALPLDAGTAVAIAIHDNRSLLGVTEGALADEGLALGAGQAADLAHASAPYPWRHDAFTAGTAAIPGAPHARWRVTGTIGWNESGARLTVRGARSGGGEVALVLSPGRAVATVDGQELQRLNLTGAPLGERALEITADATVLTATIGPQRLVLDLATPISEVRWEAKGGARLDDARFATGPQREP